MPTPTQMEAAQMAYSRRLAANQNSRIARSNAKLAQMQKAWETQTIATVNRQAASTADQAYAPLAGLSQVFAACLFFGALLAAAYSRRQTKRTAPQNRPYGYTAAPSLLTPTEAKFHAVLTEAIGPMATIQCKVRLADLLLAPRNDLGAFRRVSQKHVDFVLCERVTLRPLVAVELDDRSHDRRDRQERDAFVDAAYAQAGLPLVHVPVRSEYQAGQILTQLQPHLLC